ncbi:asparagine synthase (glutamine-hydrolyzing) [Aquisalibacillus elongatus]|uniref:asparagine synthase (glutamine-hydrolyzing) n=1 Tax=Aquisalibacillus elongatus TaxID=485577 RepID=A0A3N5BXU3_9BACI|nr:asparagine synthase (glutamine-hydrolyzing) [Aquisalibacillus elongatus]RPF50705.1 asparagine synthase (glutamine-hydrolysing) [Aquisalibacillus elongatus]
MCGFTGFIGQTENSKDVLKNMMDQIVHRGPDSYGSFIEGDVALGFRRLSIIDLEHGSQPLYNEDQSVVLVFNGEIYNFQELKGDLLKNGHIFQTNTDSEVLIHGYEEYGEAIVERLRGMFAFVIWDKNNQKLFAARDMFGIKPFYYSQMTETFLFGSEIKSFLPHPHFKKELNKRALKPYLTFQFPVLNETFFKGVYKLPAAHYLVFQDGKLDVKRYWTPEFNSTDESFEKIVQDVDHTIKESVNAHRISDVKVGSFLSSGVDSSYVASVLKPNKTFTVGFSDRHFSEIDNAKTLSDHLGIENINEVLDSDQCFDKLEDIQYIMDEPHSNPSIIPLYFLSELASRDVTVVLSGEGADELFGGYAEYETTPPLRKYKKLPKWFRQPLGKMAQKLPDMKGKNFLIRGGLPADEWFIGQAKIFSEDEATDLLNDDYQLAPTVKDIVSPYYKEAQHYDDLTKMQHLDLHLWLVNDILLKADKMSMAHSLELRVPFLDKQVMEVASKIKSEYRVNEKDTKYALRVASKKALPEESANRKKIGFPVPIRNWIKHEPYYEKIKSYFMDDYTKQFFNQKDLMKLLDEHYEGQKNNARKIWTIFMFLVWYKKYFKEPETYDEKYTTIKDKVPVN